MMEDEHSKNKRFTYGGRVDNKDLMGKLWKCKNCDSLNTGKQATYKGVCHYCGAKK